MSRFELPPQYDPHAVERPLYGRWLERGVFTARADSPKPPYVIVIPPPNVTAVLHMGQGLNNVTQDVLIRFERMRGREALWLPGTDHAGIATQNVVERLIAKEGKTRFDLGRDAFVARVWAFVKETGGTILEQLKMIGAPCDWSRRRGGGGESQGRAPSSLRGQGRPVADHRPAGADHRRRRSRARVRDGLREGDPGARRDRLRDRPAAQVRDAAGDDRGRADGASDARAEDARRARPLRGAQPDHGHAEGGRPAREGGAASARGAALLPLRLGGGAAAVRSVVREDEAARRAGARGVPERGHSPRPRAVGRDVCALDGEHPGLDTIA